MKRVLFLLLFVLSACANPQSHAPSSNTLANDPATATVAPFQPTIGGLYLGMKATDVVQLLGEPAERTTAHALGSPEWHYNGIVLILTDGDEPRIRSLSVSAPYTGKTAEGFGLGDSRQRFEQIYHQQAIHSYPNSTELYIGDPAGLRLSVSFNDAVIAEYMLIQNEP